MNATLEKIFFSRPRWFRRTALSTIVLLDAALLGLLYGFGSLNVIDTILGGALPNDMVWLLQIVQSFGAGFGLVKVAFDDIPTGIGRNIAIASSPALLFLLTLVILELLFSGQEKGASITFDMVSLGTNTLIWSATYLSIAIGLTLTYKVQGYGNFAQSEFFMVGMFVGMILGWSEYYYPLYETPGEGVITWSLLIRALLGAFVLTGLFGIIVDRGVYRGFRIRKASPQVMMIASLGIALMLRAIYFMRFSSSKVMFHPDADFQHIANRWEFPTKKIRFNIGDRSLDEGRTYNQFNCEQSTDPETGNLLFDETGEPMMERIVSEGSKPAIEIYDIATDCASALTTNYPYYKGALPAIVFLSVALLVILLNKSRLGMRMRAVADNPDLAASSGINVERIQLTSAFLSAGITGLGGAIFSVTLLFNPTTAFSLLLPSFAVIVLGTIGSVQGAIVASLLVGFVRAVSSPILVGVGYPLDRSGYSAMGGVMPYIFLVAILMIMPKGIGDAWENWKIESTRKRSERPPREISPKSTAALAILPTGILGLHHWSSGRSDKAQNFSILAISAYVFHRISGFISRNSFAKDSCSRLCSESETRETNLALLTGRNDGTIKASDSPFFSDTITELDEKWLDLMQTEIQVVNLISDLGEIIWPAVPILLWLFAIVEGLRILSGRDSKQPLSENGVFRSVSATIDSINPKPHIRNLWNELKSQITKLDKLHSELAIQAKTKSMRGLSRARETSLSSLNSLSSRIQLAFLTPLFNRLSGIPFLSGLLEKKASETGEENESNRWRDRIFDPYGREGKRGSNQAFIALLIVMLIFVWWLPISSDPATFRWDKMFQFSNVMQTVCIFALMAFSLNLHTGYTGMVNFGVVFFVGIGAITICVLSAPTRMNGYGWPILPAAIVGILLSSLLGWALAYPTARLRTDYFAIVTISLGEIVRLLLSAEPLLRTGPTASAIGLGSYPLPFKEWWFCGSDIETGPDMEFLSPDACRTATPEIESPSLLFSDLLNLGEPAPYSVLLAIICICCVLTVWALLESLLSSPWGRILKAIREDEEVAQHHGHDVLRHKAASLALGAGIASLAGVLWAWKLTGLSPSFMSPASTTFLVWAAFIIGGSANNKGMVVGAFIIVLMEFVFNVLVVASYPDLPLYYTAERIDGAFVWLVTDQWEVTKVFVAFLVIGIVTRSSGLAEIGVWGALVFAFTAVMMEGDRALDSATNYAGEVTISGGGMVYVKLLLVGGLMLYSLKFNPKGLLPEVPARPERPNGGTPE